MSVFLLYFVVALAVRTAVTDRRDFLEHVADSPELELIRKEIILTDKKEVTSVGDHIHTVLNSPDGPGQIAEAYNNFVWGFRKRGQKLLSLMSAHALVILQTEGNTEQDERLVLDHVKKALTLLYTRTSLLEDGKRAGQNEFRWFKEKLNGEPSTSAEEGADVNDEPMADLDLLLEMKKAYHEFVAGQCIPTGYKRDESSDDSTWSDNTLSGEQTVATTESSSSSTDTSGEKSEKKDSTSDQSDGEFEKTDMAQPVEWRRVLQQNESPKDTTGEIIQEAESVESKKPFDNDYQERPSVKIYSEGQKQESGKQKLLYATYIKQEFQKNAQKLSSKVKKLKNSDKNNIFLRFGLKKKKGEKLGTENVIEEGEVTKSVDTSKKTQDVQSEYISSEKAGITSSLDEEKMALTIKSDSDGNKEVDKTDVLCLNEAELSPGDGQYETDVAPDESKELGKEDMCLDQAELNLPGDRQDVPENEVEVVSDSGSDTITLTTGNNKQCDLRDIYGLVASRQVYKIFDGGNIETGNGIGILSNLLNTIEKEDKYLAQCMSLK